MAAALMAPGTTTLRRLARIEEVNRIVEVLTSIGVECTWLNANDLQNLNGGYCAHIPKPGCCMVTTTAAVVASIAPTAAAVAASLLNRGFLWAAAGIVARTLVRCDRCDGALPASMWRGSGF